MLYLKNFEGDQRLFTYKVAYDGGSAPNPYYGLCTLAICKPKIRSVAKAGDVVVGLGCGNDSHRIVYCMVVDAYVSWKEYIKGCKSGFLDKIKLNQSQNLKRKIPKNSNDQGDCIWRDDIYLEVLKSSSGHGGEDDFTRDVTNGKNVLISKTFWYFGKGNIYSIHLPDEPADGLKNIIPYGQGHRSTGNNSYREQFTDFFNQMLIEKDIKVVGKHGSPKEEPGKIDLKTCSLRYSEERESDASDEEH